MNTLRKESLSKGKWLISAEVNGVERSTVTNNSMAIDAAFGDFEDATTLPKKIQTGID